MSSPRQPGVGDRGLGGFDRQHHRVGHEAATDPREPDAGDRDLVLELVARLRHRAGVVDRRVRRRERPLLALTGRLEQRDPDVLGVLEQHLHLHAHEHVVGGHVHEVGGEADAVVLLDGDDRDQVRRREARDPRLLVEGEPGDDRTPRHLGRRPLVRTAVRAHRARRVAQLATAGAALEAKRAVLTRLPEELVELGQLGQHPSTGIGHDRSSSRSVGRNLRPDFARERAGGASWATCRSSRAGCATSCITRWSRPRWQVVRRVRSWRRR